MSAVKISQLPDGFQLQNADLIPVSRGVENFSIKGNEIATSSQLQSVSSSLETSFNSISSSNVNAVKRVFTGDGVQTSFDLNLTNPSTNVNGYRVDIDGVIQEPGTNYTVSNGNIVFQTAPDIGNKIVVVTAEVLSTVSLSSNVIADNFTTNNLTVLSSINIAAIKRSFVGTGSQTSFALTGFTPSTNPNSYRIDIDGILQEPGVAYTISGGNLVFSAAPGNNTKITVITSDILSTTSLPSAASFDTLQVDGFPVITTNTYLGGFKNKVINGNFDIWQRGTSLTSGTGGQYLADRWSNFAIGSTYTVSRENFTPGQTDVPNEPQFFHRTVVSSVPGDNNYVTFAQQIENVRILAGKTITCSFWAKADAPKNICATVAQDFGTGGSPSSRVINSHTSNFQLTTSWQKFTFTITLPSVTGKTFGINNNSYLIFGFWFDAGQDYSIFTNNLGHQSGTFDIAQCQVEEGFHATPFEQRPFGTELALCQRYYEKSYPVNITPGTPTAAPGNSGAAYELQKDYITNLFSGALIQSSFKQTKRVIPAITVYAPFTGDVNNISVYSSGTVYDRQVQASTSITSQRGVLIWPIAGTVINSGYIFTVHWAVDAEIATTGIGGL
jgi:hypothetical protein